MAPSGRALRVGVLLGGNLVEERIFKQLTPVSIGQSLRCTLSIPAEGLPGEHVLFAVDEGRWLLRLTSQMTGRLAQGGVIKTELREGTIPVERGARGKLQLGDATVLFQEVTAPPTAPRPQLPASVRGTFADRIDRRLAIIVAASLVVHMVIGTWAWLGDREHDSMLSDPLTAYEPPSVEMLQAPPDEPEHAPEVPEPGIATPAVPSRQTPRPMVPQQRVDRVPEPEDPGRWAQVMTGNTDGPNGQNEIKNRQPGASLDKQIDDIREHGRDINIGRSPTSRDSGTHLGTGPDGPQINGPEIAQVPKKQEDPIVRIRPVPGPPNPDQPTLTADMVVARIVGQYLVGLQRCYAKFGLSHDEGLSAKVAIAFTVTDHGVTADNSAHGANGEVDACIQSFMGTWRFPVPKDKEGDPTDAPFKLALVLQPSTK